MLFYKEKTNDKERYFWNMMGGLINSASSILLLSIATRLSGAAAGGIFSLAYSTAQLLETIGLTSVREIQSTDVKREYPFASYLGFRVITCVIMILISVVYAFILGGDPVKKWAIVILTCYKSIDAFADVFQGLFQLNDRIDLAGKELAIRPLLSTIGFFIALYLSDNLILACFSMVLISFIWLLIFDFPICKVFEKIRCDFKISAIKNIFIVCLPLFLGTFLMNYISNAPKFAINSYLSDVEQNTYGFLAMPAFVINLFSLFYFRPMLTELASLWAKKAYKQFFGRCRKCMFAILLLTVMAEAGSYFLGIPVLNIISGRDLNSYRNDLLIIMLGGAMTALITLFHNVFACVRQQKLVLLPYISGAACALIISPVLVRSLDIKGACLAYTASNMVVAVMMMALYLLVIKRSGISGNH